MLVISWITMHCCKSHITGGFIMDIEIPLDKMTTTDKLRVLEMIWDDLQRTPEQIPSPSWHAKVLQERQEEYEEGISEFSDWSEAKKRIRDQLK